MEKILDPSKLAPGIQAVQGDFLTRTRVVKSPWMRRLLTFLMVFGPGLIVMEADNDAGAVSTYTQAGAQYGLKLLWLLLLLLPVTYFCQEMVVRLGIATGEGHAAMIYKRFGKWWGRFSLFDLELVNFFTLVTEFAGISLAFSAIGVSPWISVPLAAVGLITMVLTGSYLRWERVTIFLCLLDVTWFWLGFRSGFGASEVVRDTLVPAMPTGGITFDYIFLVIAIVGTTIAPWQLFFQQSCVADKKLRFSDLDASRWDTFIGAVFTVIVAGAMMMVGATLFRYHTPYTDPAQMANVLGPAYGKGVKAAVLMLMVNASVLGTTAVSLSSAWAWAEVKGWSHSLQMKFSEAKGFYLTYVGAVMLAAAIVLIPKAPLQAIILGVQVLAGVMLPSALVFLQVLLNDKELLGERFVNRPWNNRINWIIIALMFALSAVLAAQVLLPNLFPASAA
ncbi:MAG: Nramp family divalent metal transporter [Holophaga sp.]|jgi:Mn2+/Fe2+ NRAMP family transporter